MNRARRLTLAFALVAVLTSGRVAAGQTPDAAIVGKAKAIHERVITLDTHVDIDARNFTAGPRDYAHALDTQVNLPKMEKGGLDAAFFIVYVGQGPQTAEGYDKAYAQAIAKFDAIHRLVDVIAPDRIGLALTTADVRKIAASGRKVALIGVENAYPVGTDLSRIKEFYDRGGRYLSLAHNGHSQFADSNTGERDGKWQHNGLSDLGKQAIAEMNRVGFMIDLSHPSKQANLQAIALSKAPVIASHSSARAVANHSRNLDDEELMAIKKSGGVVQTVAFDGYVKIKPPDSPERAAAMAEVRKAMPTGGPDEMTDEQRAQFRVKMAEVNKAFPASRATVADFVNHVDYLVKKVGVDHVGMSSDFDGGGGVDGWSGADETFNVTLELVRRGYTEEQIGKLWSGNLLRVMDAVQRVAANLQAATK
ncbi:Membrane dipeptidase (Peptidase family M19) [Luteitalea pratensis]|uniref:Membrane dipeptidase (Peptidase family M19) n=1 Tax=Luteitalea pratensis TaxID=1855912 RepID=A0A143PWP5_LUTPR|nr:membrane dipeptidase [Luteitalea pratensis]AMY12603.1 Membrane dipeptidase (Peptidase family M19) [Luteitalea pratensis]